MSELIPCPECYPRRDSKLGLVRQGVARRHLADHLMVIHGYARAEARAKVPDGKAANREAR